MSATFDRRRTPARADLAADHLRGVAVAERYVPGVEHMTVAPAAPLFHEASAESMRESELLFGETFTVYDRQNGFAWGQSGRDSYVGWTPERALRGTVRPSTHRVAVGTTLAFARPDLKSPLRLRLPLAARVTIQAEEGSWLLAEGAGWIFREHLAATSHSYPTDWVGEAERLIGTPYLWGGKTALGCDCSGLVQTALYAAGRSAPRDTDMQEAELGEPIDPRDGLRRGDLVFWRGHVGIMMDEAHLLHANAHHMMTAIEPLAEAQDRIACGATGPVTSFRRL